MIESLSAILLSISFVITTSQIDGNHINKGQYFKSHLFRALQRSIFFISFAFYNIYWSLGSALIFAALFDLLLNIKIGKQIFYLGETAKWYIFWNKHRFFYIALKPILLTIGVLLFFL